MSLKTKILGFADPETNQGMYKRFDVVSWYSTLSYLESYESFIISELKSLLPKIRMLDIGVGGGRTTANFAPLVKDYVGVDYSSEMVDFCKQRFPDRHFEVMDARNLRFGDNSFDLVLFSMTGIDDVNHEDRLKILSEINRVLKKDGYFCFSTHNLNNAPKICNFKLRRNPLILMQEPRRMFLVRWFNRSIYKELKGRTRKHLIFYDGDDLFRVQTYYVMPDEQIKQLRDVGFRKIKVIDSTRKEAVNLSQLPDYWLGYACRK